MNEEEKYSELQEVIKELKKNESGNLQTSSEGNKQIPNKDFARHNTFATILDIIAIVIFAAGFVWSVYLISFTYYGNKILLAIGVFWECFVTGMLLIALAEIIKIWEHIKNK